MKTLSNKIGFLGALFNILTTLIILSLALFCSNLFVCLIIIIIQSIIGFLIGKHLSNLKKCNTTDYLTGLANKGYFSNRLLKEISQAKKYNIIFGYR
jgi:glucose-6-phosphate-specific signal transduction histidine kinase